MFSTTLPRAYAILSNKSSLLEVALHPLRPTFPRRSCLDYHGSFLVSVSGFPVLPLPSLPELASTLLYIQLDSPALSHTHTLASLRIPSFARFESINR